jgi:hypothetical protein
MPKPPNVEKRKRLARKAIAEFVNKGGQIGKKTGKAREDLRKLLNEYEEQHDLDEDYFNVISNEDLTDLYIELLQHANDRITTLALVSSRTTVQENDSIGRDQAPGSIPPEAPMVPVGDSNSGEECAEEKQVADELVNKLIPEYEDEPVSSL